MNADEKCDACGGYAARGDEIVVCPNCERSVCTTRCCAGSNTLCFDCEENGDDDEL